MSDETTSTDSEPKPWERLHDEHDKAWLGFQAWLDTPSYSRSLDRAYQKYRGNPKKPKSVSSAFVRWSNEYRWRERSAAYDEAKRAEDTEAVQGCRQDAKNSVWKTICRAVEFQNGNLETMSVDQRTKYLVALRQLADSITEKNDGDGQTRAVEYGDQWMPPDA